MADRDRRDRAEFGSRIARVPSPRVGVRPALRRERGYPPPGALGPRAIAAWALRRYAGSTRVTGLENIPASGGVLLVARHYHHLLDGAMLIARVPRNVHIVVGLDWAPNRLTRRVMETACRLADWPVVLRAAQLEHAAAYAKSDLLRYTRRGMHDTVRLLSEGRVVCIFPQGYPVIEPGAQSPRENFLPFSAGFVRVARAAQRSGASVSIVPIGFTYRKQERWDIVMRVGHAIDADLDDESLRGAVEMRVKSLSAPHEEGLIKDD